MSQLNGPSPQFRPGFSGWLRLALTLAIGAATLAAMAFLAFSLLAILIPVALIGGLLFYFFGPKTTFHVVKNTYPKNQDIIDAEYQVISPDNTDQDR